MSPGSSTESYPASAHIKMRENPGKNLNQVTFPDRESNPGHLVSRPDALTVTPQTSVDARSFPKVDLVGAVVIALTFYARELRFVIGTHCCERVILVSVQSAASASATEIKDSRMQLRRATSAVHKRAAKCTQADGDIF
ncbi:hypothetical protein ANN_05760 [Periplaneta americana]|uniref:Uncharacterized protein n=1 Tax=Periplaneta americana TaxID=6978 RepID=A0ABQ8TDF0_PERAM|nr:hypothetical protein ANN_05760 [Periplaneta americana]